MIDIEAQIRMLAERRVAQTSQVPWTDEPRLAPAAKRERRVWLLAAAAVVVLLAIVGAVLLTMDGDSAEPTEIITEPPDTIATPDPTVEPAPTDEDTTEEDAKPLIEDGPLSFSRALVPPIDWSGWPGTSFEGAVYVQAHDGQVWRTAGGSDWLAVTDLGDLGPDGWESNWRYLVASDSLILSVGMPNSGWYHEDLERCWSPGNDLVDLAVSSDGEVWELAQLEVPPEILTAEELGACVRFPNQLSVGRGPNGEGFVMTATVSAFFDQTTYAARIASEQQPGFAEAEQRFHAFAEEEGEPPNSMDAEISVNLASDDGRAWVPGPATTLTTSPTTPLEIPEDLATQGSWHDLGTLGLLNIDLDDDSRVVSLTLVDEQGQTTWRPDPDLRLDFVQFLGAGPDFAVFRLNNAEVLVVRRQ
jgi:hypothetical protein